MKANKCNFDFTVRAIILIVFIRFLIRMKEESMIIKNNALDTPLPCTTNAVNPTVPYNEPRSSSKKLSPFDENHDNVTPFQNSTVTFDHDDLDKDERGHLLVLA